MESVELTSGTIDYQDTGGDGPVVVLVGGLLMVGKLRVPKLDLTPNRFANVAILANIAGVYGFGAARCLPEYLACVGFAYMLMSLIYGQVKQSAREAERPPLFATPHASIED